MLGHEGVNLVLGGRSRDKLEALEKEITDSGGRVAEAVRGALTVPDGEEAGFSVHEV
jgi:short-subunit dehydrogenase